MDVIKKIILDFISELENEIELCEIKNTQFYRVNRNRTNKSYFEGIIEADRQAVKVCCKILEQISEKKPP